MFERVCEVKKCGFNESFKYYFKKINCKFGYLFYCMRITGNNILEPSIRDRDYSTHSKQLFIIQRCAYVIRDLSIK